MSNKGLFAILLLLAAFAAAPFAAIAPVPVIDDETSARIIEPVINPDPFTACPTCVSLAYEPITISSTMASTLPTCMENETNETCSCLSGVPAVLKGNVWWAWASPRDGWVYDYYANVTYSHYAVPDHFANNSSSNGWRYASSGEWVLKPNVSQGHFGLPVNITVNLSGIVFPVTTVEFCSAHIFDPEFTYCDYNKGLIGYVTSLPNVSIPGTTNQFLLESWFVHDSCPLQTNALPIIAAISIIPSNPSEETNISCNVTVTDAEQTATNVTFEWYNNTVNQASLGGAFNGVQNNIPTIISNISSSNFAKGETWYCRARAFDGTNYSSWGTSNSTIIANSVPTGASVINFSNAPAGHWFTVIGSVSDADGGSDIASTNASATVGSCVLLSNSNASNSFNVQFNCSSSTPGTATVSIGFTDSSGNYAQASASNAYPDQSPALTAPVLFQHLHTDSIAVCSPGNFSDADGDMENIAARLFTWYKNSLPVGGTSGTLNLTAVGALVGDSISCSQASTNTTWPATAMNNSNAVVVSEISCLSGVPAVYKNGLWWAWASNCDGHPWCWVGTSGNYTQGLAYSQNLDPSHMRSNPNNISWDGTWVDSNGWRYATEEEFALANRPIVFPEGTSDFGDIMNFYEPMWNITIPSVTLCAAGWFDPLLYHCDYYNGASKHVSRLKNTNLGPNNTIDFYNESWFVHDPCGEATIDAYLYTIIDSDSGHSFIVTARANDSLGPGDINSASISSTLGDCAYVSSQIINGLFEVTYNCSSTAAGYTYFLIGFNGTVAGYAEAGTNHAYPDRAPSLTKAVVSSPLYPNSIATCTPGVWSDPDGDLESLNSRTYNWYKNNILQPGTSDALDLAAINTQAGDSIICREYAQNNDWPQVADSISDPVTVMPDNSGTVVSVNYNDGWNLISLPVNVSNNSTSAIWPGAASSLFAYNNSYVIVSEAGIGRGYWLKFNGNYTKNYTGSAVSFANVSLNARWNMVGSISGPVNISNIRTEPAGILVSEFYGYNGNNYEIANTIMPGKGYWVKTSQSGRLILGTPPSTQIKVTDTSGMSYLRISDSKAANMKVFLGTPTKPDLPPVMSGFDARYTTDRYIEAPPTSGYKDYNVSITTTSYPIKVEWKLNTGYTYTLYYTSGGVLQSKSISGAGSLTITDSTVKKMTLRVTKSIVVPKIPSQVAS